jgi:amidase
VIGSLGCAVVDREPDFSGVDEVFQTLRAADFAYAHGHELESSPHLLKDTVIWNTERGLRLSACDVAAAEARRTELYARVAGFLEDVDYLVLPVSQVAPFAAEVEWVREINGVPMATYIDWMATCYAISCLGLPAASVPCGFTPDGLPVGLQIVGRRHRDFDVLALAHAFERATGFARSRPAVAV